jgi:hypothetical protein
MITEKIIAKVRKMGSEGAPVGKLPNGASALLAICSDLDETPSAEAYFEIMKFLNTTDETSMGPGVGLEVGNTIYFDMPQGHFSYWSASEADRARIRALIRSGHIDCLHSFGDLARTREYAARALDELAKHECWLRVWVDHATAVTNFGSDIMRGHGDDRDHPAYHADLTVGYGIRYVWRGRVTSVIGQNKPVSFKGIANWSSPVASLRTLAKEAVKQVAARVGSAKYELHAGNAVLRRASLRDGAPVSEFLRSNPHWGGVSSADNAKGMAEVLTSRVLDTLVERGGVSILYTHLGKADRSQGNAPLPPATVAAFRRLAEYQERGQICVTTTARLLNWCEQAEPNGVNANWRPLSFPDLE